MLINITLINLNLYKKYIKNLNKLYHYSFERIINVFLIIISFLLYIYNSE